MNQIVKKFGFKYFCNFNQFVMTINSRFNINKKYFKIFNKINSLFLNKYTLF